MKFHVSNLLIICCFLLSGCGAAGTLVNGTYSDTEKYKFSITKKSDDIFFDLKSSEDIRICKSDLIGVFVRVIPSDSPAFSYKPKELLKKYIPIFKKNVSQLSSQKKKNKYTYLSKMKFYEAWFMGDLGWTPTRYIFWGGIRKSDSTGFVIVLKVPLNKEKFWIKQLMATVKTFKIIH